MIVGLALVSIASSAQTSDKRFNNFSVNNGLSQSTVFAITQDTLGFMWVGTQDGLNRYDGRNFIVYRPKKNDNRAVSSFYIRTLFRDAQGTVWVGGNGGIDAYNYLNNSFEKFNINPGQGEWYIAGIIQDEEGSIWTCTNAGEVYVSDRQKKKFRRVLSATTSGIREIYGIIFRDHDLLLGTGKGLWTFNTRTNKISPVHAGVPPVRINCLSGDGKDIWIGTEGEGLLKWEANTRSFKRFSFSGSANSLANNNVRSVKKDYHGNLWIGTFSGLSVMSRQGIFKNYYHDPKNEFTIGQNSVRCIYRDRQNGMWLGTFYGGLGYFHDQLISFNTLGQGAAGTSLNDDVVNVMKQDKQGNFWIGTESGGLNYWRPSDNRIRYFTAGPSGNNLSSNTIKSIEFDEVGNIFLGTHNSGLNILNPNTGAVKSFRHNPADTSGLSGDMVYALLRDHEDRVWVGTRNGLDIYNGGAGFTHFYKDKAGRAISATEITYLMQDSKKRIWIGTINGVSVFESDKGLLKDISNNSLSYNVVNVIAEDFKGRIWVGTRDGLNLFDEKRNTFINYSDREDFLKGNINSIVTDAEGNLWITTNNSLVKYVPDLKSTIYFDQSDGLQNNPFNVYAGLRAADGMLLFGGIRGISYFYPGALKQTQLQLKVTFTGLEVFNRLVIPGDSTGILEQHINEAEELSFSSDYKQFTLLFNTFNYISDNHTSYIYRLDGFDKDWQKTDGLHKATYTNLQPGTYIFHVKALGPFGEISPERLLTIVIKPVWYKSNWFYMLMTIAIIATAIFLYRVLTERMRALHQLRLERVNREKSNYINKIKMDFFTNVSHELRTPLTLIMAPLEELLQQPAGDKKQRRSHELMMRNARRLYNIVNQLFEFKKTEMGTRQLRVGKRDLSYLIKDIYRSFIPLSEKKKINYDYETSLNELFFFFDKEAVENIIFNLLSNAFKYTMEGQTITVTLDASPSHAIITVSDTGKGMAAEHLDKIFDRFYQVDGQETNLGSGVGLAFTRRLVELHHGYIEVASEPGKGSAFMVRLPLEDGVYQHDARVDAVDDREQADGANYFSGNILPVNDLSDDLEMTGTEPDYETLLIVDDNREIVSYLKEYFSKQYRVVTAYDGKEALEAIDKTPPDAIVSDVMMPEMDGLHFCKKIKQNIQTSHIPVLLLTAKSETVQQLKGLEMGADDYITKPFSVSVLEARLQTLLRSRKKLREFYASGKEIEPEKLTFNNLDQEFLEKAISVIEANLDEYDFSVEKLSRELGMSRSNLYLKLKAITGESVTALIKRIRLKKATELLEMRKYTIAEIAYMCGFNTPSYFSTAFKQFYGYMPTEHLDRKEKDIPG